MCQWHEKQLRSTIVNVLLKAVILSVQAHMRQQPEPGFKQPVPGQRLTCS